MKDEYRVDKTREKINEDIKEIQRETDFPPFFVKPRQVNPNCICYRVMTIDGKDIFTDEPPVKTIESAIKQAKRFAWDKRKPTKIQQRRCVMHYYGEEGEDRIRDSNGVALVYSNKSTKRADFFESDTWVDVVGGRIYKPE